MRVLIADDSKLMRERLAAAIAEVEGAELVGQTRSVDETLAAVGRLKPDLVVLDIRMPGGNGIDVLAAIKQLPEPPTVVMLTAFSYPQYRQRCLDLGADYFFDKSTEFERVAEVIAGTIGGDVAEPVGM